MKATELYNVYTQTLLITKMNLHGSINNNKWDTKQIKMFLIEEGV